MSGVPVFGPDATAFYRDLAHHNDRSWFTANRARYEAEVRAPMETLLSVAERRYGPGRVTRPNRDVRFSADKSPYSLSASLVAGGLGGVYLRFDVGGIEAGGGLYDPSRDQLQRAREAIGTRPAIAGGLRTIVGHLHEAGFELAGPELKTAPRGWSRDHPAIDLLRLTHFAASRHLPPDADESAVAASWDAVQPLLHFVQRHIGPAVSWP